MSKTADDFKVELDQLVEYINDEKNKIINGEERDLSGLDNKVDLLCQQIEEADAAVAQAAEPYMADMITALESLAEVLKEKA